MLSAFNEAQAMRGKIKHFGVDEGDADEIRRLLYQLMIFAEVFSHHDGVRFYRTSSGWSIDMEARISPDTKLELLTILGDG